MESSILMGKIPIVQQVGKKRVLFLSSISNKCLHYEDEI